MKAALFTDSYLPNTDGVVSSILALRRGLRASGHDWAIFAPDSPGYRDPPDDQVHRFKAFKFPPYPDYRAAIFPYAIPACIAKKENLALVHSKAMATMAIAAYKFARRSRLPSVASVETMIPDGVHYLSRDARVQAAARSFTWGYMRWLYSHFDLVTAPSAHTQGILLQNGIGSTVMPSPIDTGVFAPDAKSGLAARRELGLGKSKVILSVGRVVKEKNYDFLLRAAKKVRDPNVKFLVVGKGPYLETLKSEAKRLGVSGKFTFVGYIVSKEKLISYYNSADAFVFPSKFETQGLTLLEAFACGKPAVAMGGTPMEEILSDGRNGYLFSDDESECAEKLQKCLQNSLRFAPYARKAALQYSIPTVTKRLVTLYKSLL